MNLYEQENKLSGCNAIYYFIAALLRIRFSVPLKRDESAVCNPAFKVSPLGLKIAVSSRCTDTENRIFKRGAMKIVFQTLKAFFFKRRF